VFVVVCLLSEHQFCAWATQKGDRGTARALFPHSILSTSHRQQLCPLPLYFPFRMATKAAYKRVRMLGLRLLRTIHLCSSTPALKGVCCHAEGATPFRLGCPRRERHPDLCVQSLSRRGPDTHPPFPGNFIIVRASRAATAVLGG